MTKQSTCMFMERTRSNVKPFILRGKWLDGHTLLAFPKNPSRITKYEDLKKIVRQKFNHTPQFNHTPHGARANHYNKPLSGWVGFLSYDLGAELVGIKQNVEDDIKCPEVYFAFCDIFPIPPVGSFKFHENPVNGNQKSAKTFAGSNLTKRSYKKKINSIKRYLFDGETYQVNFSQRSKTAFNKAPFLLFQKISKLNPSPYQFYCEDENFAVISNSPERLIYCKNRHLETRPIKGTIGRGKNQSEDQRNIKKLLDSEKENAELVMIVDLERNDLGKICIPGTVKVVKHRKIEKYSHVIHTVSIIRGVMEKDKDVFDVLEAVFPGGSITGCPKKRTMEIIDKLEDFKRGVYCGSAGYILENGDFEFNIMIRTAFCKNNTLYFHSGGGIVMDSDPEKEYKETIGKANAFFVSL